MVSEIDNLISQRQALEFLKLGPSILNPLLWGTTLGDLFNSFLTLSKETADLLSSNYFQEQFSNRLISILLISFFSVLLFIYSGAISNQLNATAKRFEKVAGFLSASVKYLLRYVALYSLIHLAQSLGVFGIRGDLIAENFYLWVGYFILALWLAERLQMSWLGFETDKVNHRNIEKFAVLGAVAFSAKAIVVKLAYRYNVDAVTLLMFRMLFAMPLFGLMAWWAGRGKASLTRAQWKQVLLVGFSGYYLASFLDFWGLQYISASLERLILYLNPTVVLLFGWWLYGRRIRAQQLWAMAISYTGVMLVFGHELHFDGWVTLIGGGLVFASAISYAVYLLMSGELVAA
ncbi:MAG: EamA family transporter, partial [Rhodobacterales bacterium]|nr:EamA family transporter [Rhodobacterales bacterium]